MAKPAMWSALALDSESAAPSTCTAVHNVTQRNRSGGKKKTQVKCDRIEVVVGKGKRPEKVAAFVVKPFRNAPKHKAYLIEQRLKQRLHGPVRQGAPEVGYEPGP